MSTDMKLDEEALKRLSELSDSIEMVCYDATSACKEVAKCYNDNHDYLVPAHLNEYQHFLDLLAKHYQTLRRDTNDLLSVIGDLRASISDAIKVDLQ